MLVYQIFFSIQHRVTGDSVWAMGMVTGMAWGGMGRAEIILMLGRVK